MWDSDSDDEPYMPAVLNRPKVANYVTHESFTIDTRDHEDHTFCGVMFDIRCLAPDESGAAVPLEFLQVEAVSVRGDLGPLTVWSTPGSYKGKEHEADQWELLYEREHAPSRQDYQKLELTSAIRLAPGESCGIYVHSKLRGDDAIVYDNQRSRVTYEDSVFRVLPGLAHLSNRPFGRHGMWGFPWRQNREFVGRFFYGVGYKLWNPEVHSIFPSDFKQVVKTFLMAANRQGSPLHRLQDEVLFYILNMCRHDWFRDPAQQQRRRRPEQDEDVATMQRGVFGARYFGSPWGSLGRLTRGPRTAGSDGEASDDSDDDDLDLSDGGASDARSMSDLQGSRQQASEEDLLMGDSDDEDADEDSEDEGLESAYQQVAHAARLQDDFSRIAQAATTAASLGGEEEDVAAAEADLPRRLAWPPSDL